MGFAPTNTALRTLRELRRYLVILSGAKNLAFQRRDLGVPAPPRLSRLGYRIHGTYRLTKQWFPPLLARRGEAALGVR
jgi:hypothetical protein